MLRRAAFWSGVSTATALALVLASGSNPNHTPPELLETPPAFPAGKLCVDNEGRLWWERLGTVSVVSELGTGELRPLDKFELDAPRSWANLVCLLLPQPDQSGMYALTTRGQLLSLSVSDSRLSAVELADCGTFLTHACVAGESSRTIVASNWNRIFLIDLLDRTISPLPVPVSEGIVDLEYAGGTRFIVAFVDGTICLCDSQDITSPIQLVKGAEYPGILTTSPDRTLMALHGDGRPGGTVEVAVRDSSTLEQVQSWQFLGDDFFVSDITWLDDRRLAVSLRTNRRGDRGEVVILQLGSTSRRRLKLDFEPWSILAIAPNRLAIADRDGGVRIIQLDP